MWVKDLTNVGYRDIHNLPDDDSIASAERSPCIGRDALSGVYYHPAPASGKSVAMAGNLIPLIKFYGKYLLFTLVI